MDEGKVWDVIIVGSGPAGLTAAIYTTRGAASTLIFGGEIWGGQLMLTSQVDNFPGFPDGVMGPDLMTKMKLQAEKHGAKFVAKNAVKFDFNASPKKVTDSDGNIYEAKTVIIATGAETKWLDVPGEKKLIGKGVSSCAPCDAPFFKDKVVAVVGGGDSAMEEASYLSKFATKIYLIHRRDEFKASAVMQERVKNDPKIEVLWNSEIKEILGTERVTGVKLTNNSTPIQSGQASELRELSLDGVFVAIGHKPNSDLFLGIDKNEKGYIAVSSKLQALSSKTNIPGVFVAGDVSDDTYKQAVTAAGFGCQAGMDALKYLENNVS